MTSVFIGGSISIKTIEDEFKNRIDNIAWKDFYILIGDVPGLDKEVQKYLRELEYRNVIVYCTLGKCRNNIGGWKIKAIDYNGEKYNREFYTAKDNAMIKDSTYGLFKWDGESKGTLRNIVQMAKLEKLTFVYFNNNFRTIRNLTDVTEKILNNMRMSL
ncbi:MAG: hypothetical protein ACOCQD_00865 [archaeon]